MIIMNTTPPKRDLMIARIAMFIAATLVAWKVFEYGLELISKKP